MKTLLLTILALLAASPVAAQPLRVPQAQAPALDGVLSPDEWKGALAQKLEGGGELYLQRDDKFVYVGVRGTSHGWCHLYLTNADTVLVHHASAALGTATYLRKGERWQPQEEFAWELRETDFTPKSQAARAAYLEAHGWLANNMNTGTPGVFEFQIRRSALGGKVASLALAFASDAESPQYWPSTLADDCRAQELIFGNTPPDLRFVTGTWAKIEL